MMGHLQQRSDPTPGQRTRSSPALLQSQPAERPPHRPAPPRPHIQPVCPPTAGVRRPRSKQVLPHLLQTSRRRTAQHRKSTTRTARIEVSEPSVEHLKVKPNRWATIKNQGTPHHQPSDRRANALQTQQPKAIRITLKPRRLVVSLVYQQEPRDLGEPAKQSVGIDPGVKHNITAVSDDGTRFGN